MSSKEEIETRHKKALKAWEGEKRAAVKKAKALKGKKGKDALSAVESEYEAKLKELETKLQEQLSSIAGGCDERVTNSENQSKDDDDDDDDASGREKVEEDPLKDMSEKERKMEKARRKKEKQRQKELERQREEEEIAKNAGPNMRVVELQQLQSTLLTPKQLKIAQVPADGHCLYRAVGAHIQQEYTQVRALCAKTLEDHPDDFSPFCELSDSAPTFEDYVEQVRCSAEWGGHLELRALAMALGRPIEVFQVGMNQPLRMEAEKSDAEPIRLSYHRHYYALGEHYNQVVPETEGNADAIER